MKQGWTRTTACLTALLCMGACSSCDKASDQDATDKTAQETAEQTESAETPQTAQPLSAATALSTELSNADQNDSWDDSAEQIILSGTGAETQSDSVSVSQGRVTIQGEGTYVLSGSLEGQIYIQAADTEKVHLVLNGAEITSPDSAAIWVQNADKVILTLAEGTENYCTDGASYADADSENAPNACIFSRDDLTLNGTGSLTVTGQYNNGIQSKNDLRIAGGTISVTAAANALKGNDTVLIAGGTLTLDAGGDGIKTDNIEEADKGYVAVTGGTVTVTAAEDGIQADTVFACSGGVLNVIAGGGASASTKQHSEGFGGGWNDWNTSANSTVDETSTKGIKATGSAEISGGAITVDAADDSLHTNGNVLISGGSLTLSSGDDGIHADETLEISGGTVAVVTAYEGLEAYCIHMTDGTVHVRASDDGFNAAGGADNSGNTGGWGFGGMGGGSGELYIDGGYLYVNADGDGLDSNGDISITGGTVIVCGPTNSGNGPLDSGDNGNSISVTGGTLIAVGATGMMEAPEANYAASSALNAAAGTLITVTDESGTVLCALETPKQAAGILVSCDGKSEGYVIYSGADYDGELNEDGFGTGGTCSGGTEISQNAVGMGGGFGGGGNMGGGFGGGGFEGGGRGGGMGW